ncbi:MAG TPA: TonB-dependent receptor, partial [Chryseosolibacter sp.]|nr:TonB-dependent receptor [Chryseosolibacter sp.]
MKFVVIFTCLVAFSQISVFAQSRQQTYTISGSIVDDQNAAVPFANAAVYHNLDSILVGGAASDENGVFTIKMKPGNYYLKITFLSYQEKIIPDVNLINKNINLGTIVLSSDSRLLETVEIEGERSQMELQLDKRVFNVGSDLSTSGGNAADLLNNVPSVNVEVDGTVSLRGNENVRILINGKPSGLTSRDPDALRNLQANLVERVEVITNPSSRYEAAGEVGIINIVLKKNQQNGLNGTFTGVVGHPDFIGGSYSLNLRRKKINLFSSYGMDYRKSPGYSTLYQRFEGGTKETRQDGDMSSSELSHNIMGGLDFFINEKNTITGSIMYNFGDGLSTSKLTYNDFVNGSPAGTMIRTDREAEVEENIEGAFNYKREFKRKDQTLTMDFQYNKRLDNETSDFKQTEDDAVLFQRAKNNAVDNNWFFQSDYVHPFATDGKAEAGFRTTSRTVNNEYALEELQGDAWVVFPAFNDNLIYTESIHAGYMMAGNKFNKLSIQAGLRGEYSDILTELTETKELNHREYFNVFPSVNLGYEINKNKTLQVSYSKRINRPNFRELMPFSNFSDSRNFFQGNPNLNPEYTHAFETGYLVNWQNGSILSSAYYRHRVGDIQRVVLIENDSTTRIFPINVGSTDSYGLEFNFSYTIGKWWDINSSANFYRAITEGTYLETDLSRDTYALHARATSKMTISKGFEFQTSFFYRGPRQTTQGRQLAGYSLDLALAKDVMKGKGTITANVRDLLNTRKWRSITEIEEDNYYAESVRQRAPRQFRLTFTYRLNQM